MSELSDKALDLINGFKAACINVRYGAEEIGEFYARDQAQMALANYITELEDYKDYYEGARMAADYLKLRNAELEERIEIMKLENRKSHGCIAELKEYNKVLEDACEILRKRNTRLYAQLFSDENESEK